MDELYSHECPACGGSHPRNETEMGINFSPEVLSQALRAIYDGMNVEDEIQRDAFEEMLRIFNEAADEGVKASKKTPPRMETFLDQLKYNNEVFSAFKVHRMQNDMAARLIDENGQLKPFEKWKRDVEDIADHYCNRWLQTEYDTAVLRAHQATDWLQFEAEKDVYPNLRWMPTTSPNPDEYHKQYWRAKLTLPINHPFWKSHRPGDRWNCKCSLRQTDEPATTEAIADFKPVPSQAGLDNNPAQDGKLFSDSHPYYTEAYPGAEKAAEKIIDKRRLKTVFDEKVTMQVTRIEDEIRMNKNFETGVAVDKDGKVVIDKRGAKYSVNFTRDECNLMKDCIFTHNHPRGWAADEKRWAHIGNSFSIDDVSLAVFNDVAEIRAVTPLYTFSLKRPDGGWGNFKNVKSFRQSLNKQNTKVREILLDAVTKEYITPEQASALHYHLLWKRVAKKQGWNYTKLKTRNP